MPVSARPRPRPHSHSHSHPRRARALTLATTLSTLCVLGLSTVQGQQKAPNLPPDINKQFANPNVSDFVKRFESESREVYTQRKAVVAALGLKKGMIVADVGAGTGFFTRLFADEVGKNGLVYAVDISEPFLKHIAARSKELGQTQVRTIRCAQNSTSLPAGSVDVVFVCDVYHHVEEPGAWLGSIHDALKPGGRFVLIEFDKARAKNADFVKKHVRATKEVFAKEVEDAGLDLVDTPNAPTFQDNFILTFRKGDRPRPGKVKAVGE